MPTRSTIVAALVLIGLNQDPVGASSPVRPLFDHITTEQGLSQVTVQVVYQDHRGYLWFGTQDGLNRSDGFEITTFRHVPFRTGSLSHNWILSITEDGDGRLWVGTQDGLNRFDRAAETFATVLPGVAVTALSLGRDGALWVGSNDGLHRVDPATGEAHALRAVDGCGGRVLAVHSDTAGRVWVGTAGDGLCRLDSPSGPSLTWRSADSGLPSDIVLALTEGEDGRLWIGTRAGLVVFDEEDGVFTTPPGLEVIDAHSDTARIGALLIDGDGLVWAGTALGLLVYDPAATGVRVYRQRPGDPTSLPDDNIYGLCEDDSGLIWFGTLGAGVGKLDKRHGSFTTYRHDALDPTTLAGHFTYAFHHDRDGKVWVGTDRGLDRLDRATGTFTHRARRGEGDLPSNLVRRIHRDGAGRLWLGMIGGLVRFDGPVEQAPSRVYRHDPADPCGLTSDYVWTMAEDRTGRLWVGTSGGLNLLSDPADGRFTALRAPEELSNDTVRALFPSRDGLLWVGTYGGGLDLVDPEVGRVRSHTHDPADPTSLSSAYVYSVFEDSQERLWVGTYGGGLNLLLPGDRDRGRFLHLDSSDGLPSNVVYGTLEDRRGDLWVTTTNGLCRIELKHEPEDDLAPAVELHRFDVADGLQGTEFNAGAFAHLTTGELVVGGVAGMTIFDPDTLTTSDFQPPVELTGLRLFSRPVAVAAESALPVAIGELDTLVLSPDDRVFTLEFAALDYTDPDANRYAFRLDGFDDDWHRVDAGHRAATYTGLAPGRYLFRVTASNSDGLWTGQERTLPVVIVPAWWQTLWFRGLLLALGVLALVGASGWRIRSVNRQRDRLEAEVDARTRRLVATTRELAAANEELDAFASSVSHDLRAPLRSVVGFSEILVEDHGAELSGDARDLLARIERGGRTMQRLLEALLELSRVTRGALHKEELDLSTMAESVVADLREAEPERRVEVKIEPGLVDVGDPILVAAVLTNLLGNAWKFTSARETATIRLGRDREESERLGIPVYVVADNGAGFAMDRVDYLFAPFRRLHGADEFPGTGVGLATVRRIIRRHGGRIRARGEVGQGAEFRFTLRPENLETGDLRYNDESG